MDLSGVIFAALAVAWAGYLIPKALQHHDEVARTRSVERFSSAMRVLARREPVTRRDARLVVSPVRPADSTPVLVSTVSSPARREAARVAAARRRRVLVLLLTATALVIGLAVLVVVPRWSVAIPGGLTMLWLVVCRSQVRRARNLRWEADLAQAIESDAPAGSVARPAARMDVPGPVVPAAASVRNAQGFEQVAPEEETVAIPVAVLDAVMVPTEDGGSLWDPLPVTLPTYVTKSKAKRTVRTIDLSEPGAWTSGHTEQDTQLVANSQAEATDAEAEADPADGDAEQPRAVGS